MQYTITKLEHKEYEGRKYALGHVRALDGTELDVSFGDKWGEGLHLLAEGQTIEANPWQNPKNQKWSLYPPDGRKRSSGANPAYKQKVIEETMQRKETSIGKFQDNKEFSIMVASSMANAVNLAIAQGDPSHENVLKQRQWILDNWEVNPKDIPPF